LVNPVAAIRSQSFRLLLALDSFEVPAGRNGPLSAVSDGQMGAGYFRGS
jgi:hypothetical protein